MFVFAITPVPVNAIVKRVAEAAGSDYEAIEDTGKELWNSLLCHHKFLRVGGKLLVMGIPHK